VKNYSIVRIGHEYVVQAGKKSILKVASRRKAAQLVTSAAELLSLQPSAPQVPPQTPDGPSIDPDVRDIADPEALPDSGHS
jgi:hypothetical protein